MIAQNEGGMDVKIEGRSVSSESTDVNERDRAQATEIAVLLREDVRTLKLGENGERNIMKAPSLTAMNEPWSTSEQFVAVREMCITYSRLGAAGLKWQRSLLFAMPSTVVVLSWWSLGGLFPPAVWICWQCTK